MLVCRNQSCAAHWTAEEVEFRNEGQGLMFRCPVCGARNPVNKIVKADGTIEYDQRGASFTN
jgi:hypothetical protein